MSVLKSKRKPSQFEVFHHLNKMRKEVTDLLLRDFGYDLDKAVKKVETTFGGRPYLAALEHMTLKNLFTVPVAIDNTGTTLLADDLGNAIVADWKYKEE